MTPSVARHLRAHTAGVPALLGAVLLFGSAPSLFKLVQASPLAVVFFRLWLGVPAVALLAGTQGVRLDLSALRQALPGGALYALHLLCFVEAAQRTSIANVTFIGALSTALVMWAARPLFREHVPPSTVFSTLLALTGLAIFVQGSAHTRAHSWVGDGFAVLNLLAWTGYLLASKYARRNLGAIEYQAGVVGIAALLVAPFALMLDGALWRTSFADLGWVAVVALGPGLFGHLLVNWAHAHVPVTLTSLLLLGAPVLASVIAWPVHGEPLSLRQGLGGAVVVGGLGLSLLAGAFSATPPRPHGSDRG